MTLARGGILVEPMELAQFCSGRVNEDGVLPGENEVCGRTATRINRSFKGEPFDLAT
jgi:hypothetical protein